MLRTVCFVFFALLLTGRAMSATTIEWWQFWTDPQVKPVIEKMVAEFEKANPDIDVRLTDLTWSNGHEKIVISLASGTGPDVLELGSDWIAQFADEGHLWDMTAEVADDTDRFHGWGMSTYKGKVYAYPWILGTRVLFANRDLLIKAGFEPNWVPVTIAELKKASGKVGRLGDGIYGWGSNAAEKHRLYKKFMPFFWSHNAQIFTDDGRHCVLASIDAINALREYKQLHDESGYVANQRGIEDAFLDGKIGFIISGDWLLKRIELEKRDINLASTLFPGLQFPGSSFLGGEFLTVNEASGHKPEAMKLIEFITSPENQIRFCRANRSANPSSLEAQEDEYFQSNVHLQTFVKQIALVKHQPVTPEWVNIETYIEEAVEDALFGHGLPGEALRKARHRTVELMKK